MIDFNLSDNDIFESPIFFHSKLAKTVLGWKFILKCRKDEIDLLKFAKINLMAITFNERDRSHRCLIASTLPLKKEIICPLEHPFWPLWTCMAINIKLRILRSPVSMNIFCSGRRFILIFFPNHCFLYFPFLDIQFRN